MEITFNRLKHSLAVARKMRNFVILNQDKYTVNPDEMFTLGMLHDIGYKYCKTANEHNIVGGLHLKNQGYKYWKEVYYHGTVQTEYTSPELTLLNFIDMTTGPDGSDVTIAERLDDISNRYGNKSIQYLDACKLAQYLEKNNLII